MIFRTVCAWCSRVISEEPCSDSMKQLVMDNKLKVIISHGICHECWKRIEKNEFWNQGGNDD